MTDLNTSSFCPVGSGSSQLSSNALPIYGQPTSHPIVKVGSKIQGKFKEGDKFVLQPAMGLPSGYSAGYSYEYYGGNATYCIIPKVSIDLGCVLPYKGEYFANASLAEPMSCIIGAFHATYHTTQYVYEHQMGLKKDGCVALLGCAGPMGIGAIDYAVNGPYQSKRIVVVDINEERLERAKMLITPESAQKVGKELIYINPNSLEKPVKQLKDLTDGIGFDEGIFFPFYYDKERGFEDDRKKMLYRKKVAGDSRSQQTNYL